MLRIELTKYKEFKDVSTNLGRKTLWLFQTIEIIWKSQSLFLIRKHGIQNIFCRSKIKKMEIWIKLQLKTIWLSKFQFQEHIAQRKMIEERMSSHRRLQTIVKGLWFYYFRLFKCRIKWVVYPFWFSWNNNQNQAMQKVLAGHRNSQLGMAFCCEHKMRSKLQCGKRWHHKKIPSIVSPRYLIFCWLLLKMKKKKCWEDFRTIHLQCEFHIVSREYCNCFDGVFFPNAMNSCIVFWVKGDKSCQSKFEKKWCERAVKMVPVCSYYSSVLRKSRLFLSVCYKQITFFS